jgi:hypothetical protein
MLEYWSPDEGDSHLMVDYRELIDEHLASASTEQVRTLAELDAKAAALLDGYSGADTWDVKMLRETVKLSREHQAAA